jgi:branched-chain amino acid transport system permease protein
MVVMVVIGGSGTVLGPLLGAVSLQFLSEYLRQNYTDFHIFLLGAIIILAVIMLPQGAVNYVREARRSGEYSLLANVRRYRL